MGNFQGMWVNFALVGILIVAIMLFGVNLQKSNDSEQRLTDNQLFNNTVNNLQGELEGIENTTATQKASFDKDNPILGFGSLLLNTVVSGGKIFGGITIGIYNALIKFPAETLGISTAVTSTLTGILLVLIILGLWGVFKLGG